MYWVYLIKNTINGKIYIGQTADLVKRLARHNGALPSKILSYTNKNKGSWELIYQEEFITREEAFLREKILKSHKGRVYLRQILGL